MRRVYTTSGLGCKSLRPTRRQGEFIELTHWLGETRSPRDSANGEVQNYPIGGQLGGEIRRSTKAQCIESSELTLGYEDNSLWTPGIDQVDGRALNPGPEFSNHLHQLSHKGGESTIRSRVATFKRGVTPTSTSERRFSNRSPRLHTS
jgi:hypothetical protein